MDKAQLAAMEKAPLGYAAKIRAKIESLLTQHFKETFAKWLETEKIVCKPFFRLPMAIHPMESTDMFGGSLYQAEEDMNGLEQDLVMELTALPNVRWWHRNIARHGFAINGYIKHYDNGKTIQFIRPSKIIMGIQISDSHKAEIERIAAIVNVPVIQAKQTEYGLDITG